MSERSFIDSIAPLAVGEMRRSGILASVTIAQVCLGSGYGTSELTVGARNRMGQVEYTISWHRSGAIRMWQPT